MIKSISKGICLFICLVLTLIISGCTPSTSPEEIVNNFLFYMTNFEQQRAYDFLSKEFKESLEKNKINRESFMGYIQSPFGTPLWMGDEFSIKEKAVRENGIAKVKIQLTNPQSKAAAEAECQLRIENSEWRIVDFNLPNANPNENFNSNKE